MTENGFAFWFFFCSIEFFCSIVLYVGLVQYNIMFISVKIEIDYRICRYLTVLNAEFLFKKCNDFPVAGRLGKFRLIN